MDIQRDKTDQAVKVVGKTLAAPHKRVRRLRRVGTVCLGVILVLWLTHSVWLPPFGTYLDVGELPYKADFIVILGGGEGSRALTAVSLYYRHLAPKIIVSGLGKGLRLDRSIIEECGVPSDALIINDHPDTTWDEAQQILDILESNDARSAVIVTDAFHTRRARATFQQIQTKPDLTLTFADSYDIFQYNQWWQTPEGREAILSEYFKIVYYYFRYGVKFWG